jgi:predicted dehydrogenase
MMSDMKLRWGVISTANIGRWAVNPAIQASSNGELVAVASRNAETASEFARQWDIPVAHGSYDALLADDGIDAVYIPLPNSLHRDWTIKAAEAGKHVLCEKPLGLTEAECLAMSGAAEASGVTFMEAFMYRFHPRTEMVLQMIRDGVVGDLKMIQSVFTFRLKNPDNIRLDPTLGGGSLMDVGCYCVNISRTAAGREPVEAQATAIAAASGVDEMMAGTLRFADDLLASFQCGLSTKRREAYEIGGTDACLRVQDAFLPGKGDAVIEEHRDGDEPVIHTVDGVDEYQCMVEHFADCVLNGKSPRYTAAEAAMNMRVIEALYASVQAGGKPVTIQPRS